MLKQVLSLAEEKDIDLLGISKSSSLTWGNKLSRPLVKHTSLVGDQFLTEVSWYISLKGKKVDYGDHKWNGSTYIVRFDGQSRRAFRVDAPSYLSDRVESAFGKVSAYSCSAECLGYPHALFRAHKDIRITKHESYFVEEELMNLISEMGVSESQFRMLVEDYHDVLEMKLGY